MRELRRKVLVPSFTLTEECKATDVLALKRAIKRWKGRGLTKLQKKSKIVYTPNFLCSVGLTNCGRKVSVQPRHGIFDIAWVDVARE